MEERQNLETNPNLNIDELLEIVSMSSRDYSEYERSLLMKMMNHFQFFLPRIELRSNTEDFFHFAHQYLNYEFIEKGKFVYHDGDHADKVYIILKGSARKYEMRTWNDIQKDLTSREKEKQSSLANAEVEHYEKELSRIQAQRDHIKRRITLTRIPDNLKSRIVSSLGKGAQTSLIKNLKMIKTDEKKKAVTNYQELQKKQYTKSLGSVLSQIGQLHAIQEGEVFEDTPLIMNDMRIYRELYNKEKQFMNVVRKAREKHDEELFLAETKYRSQYFLNDVFKYKLSNTYLRGDYFGEEVLRSTKPRDSTILAGDNLHLVTMSRQDFQRAINDLQYSMETRAKHFLHVFSGFSETDISNFTFYFNERNCKIKQVIYKQFDEPDALYLVKTGEVKLLMEDHPENVQIGKSSDLKSSARGGDLKVCLLTDGQFFGEEVLLDLKQRKFTAICSMSKTILFKISKANLDILKVTFPKMYEELQTQAKTKFSWKTKRIEEISEMPGIEEAHFTFSPISKSTRHKRQTSLPSAGMTASEREKPSIKVSETHRSKGSFTEFKQMLSYRERFFRQTFNEEVKTIEQLSNTRYPQKINEDKLERWLGDAELHQPRGKRKTLGEIPEKSTRATVDLTIKDKGSSPQIVMSDIENSQEKQLQMSPMQTVVSPRLQSDFELPSQRKYASPRLNSKSETELPRILALTTTKNNFNSDKSTFITPLKEVISPGKPLSLREIMESSIIANSRSAGPLQMDSSANIRKILKSLDVMHSLQSQSKETQFQPVASVRTVPDVVLTKTLVSHRNTDDCVNQRRNIAVNNSSKIKGKSETNIVNKHVRSMKTGVDMFKESEDFDLVYSKDYLKTKAQQKVISSKHNLFRRKPEKDVVRSREYHSLSPPPKAKAVVMCLGR